MQDSAGKILCKKQVAAFSYVQERLRKLLKVETFQFLDRIVLYKNTRRTPSS